MFTSPRSHHSEIDSPELLSISGTPSGVQTPRPSGTDKRLPGILHSYFGQVGAPSFAIPSAQRPSVPFHFQLGMGAVHLPLMLAPKLLPTAPASPVEQNESGDIQAPVEQAEKDSNPAFLGEDLLRKYPTPPTSSRASSMSAHSNNDERNDGVSPPRATEASNTSRPGLSRLKSGNAVMKLRARGQTQNAITNPVPNNTTSSVYTAHLSNPASYSSSVAPNTVTLDASVQSALSSLSSNLELAKLTNGINGPNVKATPPITPRTLSNDGAETVRTTASPNERSASRTESNGASASRLGAPVPPPKGELVVTISGARGLRPSFDPYAVCVFEWIESIAHHHKQGVPAPGEGPRPGDLSVGGLPISRTGSGMGRSMAITMKSRQGSTTSLSEQKEFKETTEVTDPQWDHEAVLYVS